MTDMLADGAAWLAGQLKAHASRKVTYVRGAQRLGLSPTIGQTEFQIEDGYGLRVETSDRDFLIPAVDLVFDGQITEPKRGDKIEQTGGPNNATETFEVMAPDNQRPFRYDATRTLLRVHTKLVKVQ
jgi:hypothetical protein